MHLYIRKLHGLVAIVLFILCSCGSHDFDNAIMRENAEKLKKTNSFRYPLVDYFPETPVTETDPPKGEKHHTAEDSFAPAGTECMPGDGIISYSGRQWYGG
jgi:hypothetical protein